MKNLFRALVGGVPFSMTGHEHENGERTQCGLNIHAPAAWRRAAQPADPVVVPLVPKERDLHAMTDLARIDTLALAFMDMRPDLAPMSLDEWLIKHAEALSPAMRGAGHAIENLYWELNQAEATRAQA